MQNVAWPCRVPSIRRLSGRCPGHSSLHGARWVRDREALTTRGAWQIRGVAGRREQDACWAQPARDVELDQASSVRQARRLAPGDEDRAVVGATGEEPGPGTE